MRYLTIEDMLKACSGTWHGDAKELSREIKGVVIDSRKVEKDYCFIAVKGERSDGRDFIGKAMEAGASCVIVNDPVPDMEGSFITVDDPLEALRLIAAYYRSTFDIPVLGIIGSVGKTSTKEMVSSVLSQKYNVLKTEGNFNNDIGLPLTLMRVQPDHEMAVVEMGINHFGEMRQLSSIAKPDAVVFTNVAPCHLEFLGDLEGVLRAKSEVFENMPEDAPVFINSDDPLLCTIKDKYHRKVITYGIDPEKCPDVGLSDRKSEGLEGTGISIRAKGLKKESTAPIDIVHTIETIVKLPGEHMVKNALAGAAAGIWYGVTADRISEGIKGACGVDGRSRIIKKGTLTVIDDCYNANPASVKAGIDMLSKEQGIRIAVLGDMKELGANEADYHRQIGEYAAEKNIDMLLCTGELSKEMIGAFPGCEWYEDLEKLKAGVFGKAEELIRKEEKAAILIKASHSMNFKEIVEGF